MIILYYNKGYSNAIELRRYLATVLHECYFCLTKLKTMYTQEHLHTMYYHYLNLFHNTKDFAARSFARKQSNFFGRELGLSETQLREDKLPFVDFAELLGLKGSIAGDGGE